MKSTAAAVVAATLLALLPQAAFADAWHGCSVTFSYTTYYCNTEMTNSGDPASYFDLINYESYWGNSGFPQRIYISESHWVVAVGMGDPSWKDYWEYSAAGTVVYGDYNDRMSAPALCHLLRPDHLFEAGVK